MELDKIEALDNAFGQVAEHILGNPLVRSRGEYKTPAQAPPDMLTTVEGMYFDFFSEDESDVFGKIEVKAMNVDGTYVALTRTVKVSDTLTVVLEEIREKTDEK